MHGRLPERIAEFNNSAILIDPSRSVKTSCGPTTASARNRHVMARATRAMVCIDGRLGERIAEFKNSAILIGLSRSVETSVDLIATSARKRQRMALTTRAMVPSTAVSPRELRSSGTPQFSLPPQ